MEFTDLVGRQSPVQNDVVPLNAIEPPTGHETSFNFGNGDGCESFQVKGYGFIGLGLEAQKLFLIQILIRAMSNSS